MPVLPLALQSNPLVNPPALPYGAPPLNKVKTAHFLPAVEYGIQQAEAEIAAIIDNPDAPTFENTILALEYAGGALSLPLTVFGIFSGTKSNDKIRALEGVIGQKMSAHSSKIWLNEKLFARVKAVHDDPSSARLDYQDAMLLKKMYRGMLDGGINLDDAKKAELRNIQEKLSVLTSTFSNNVVKSTGAYKKVIDLTELSDLPQRIIEAVAANAKKEKLPPHKGVIYLNDTAIDIAVQSSNRALREELFTARRNVAYADPKFDNRRLVLEIVRGKHRIAQLLGYANTAEMILSDRMAKNAKTVNAFLKTNLDAYKPEAEAHLQKIREFALKKDGLADLKPWDTGYYDRLLTEETFQISLDDLRPYLSLDNVVAGVLKHAEKSFGIEFKKAAARKYPVHTSDVKVYEVFNRASNSFIGLFYANYYERKGAKNGGAWMDEIQGRRDDGKIIRPPMVTNDCNYPKPVNGKPTLIKFGDAETIAHELGHGLHGLLTNGRHESLNGTRVKRDAVELPSQLQENFIRQKEVLDSFAIHYETKEPIPPELLKKVQDMQTFGAAVQGLRQTYLGMLDMAWHTTDPDTIRSVEELEDSIGEIALLMPRHGGTTSTSFTHIFSGGYSAGYYGYKWAEVLDADVFGLFEKSGLYDPETSQKVRHYVYEQGGTRDPDELFRELMGRDPDPRPMFRREGLTP